MTLLLLIAVKGALMLTLGVLASKVLHRAPASMRHGVWAATFMALLLVPALDAFGPNWSVAVPVHIDRSSVSPAAPLLGEPSAFHAVVPADPWAGLVAVLGGAWTLGTVVVSSVWLTAFARARRLVRDAESVVDSAWADIAERAQAGRVRLLRSDALRVPFAWGYGRPAVVLPSYADSWDADRREAVLLHEMAHLRRRDAWTQAVAQAALALHWPNPLVWLAYRRFMDTREQACDDAVLRLGATATDYAAHLVAIAREMSPSRLTTAAVLSMTGHGELETRVRAILDSKRLRTPLGRRYLGATLALVIVTGGLLAAFQPIPTATGSVEEEDGGRWIASRASSHALGMRSPPARDPQAAEETPMWPERSRSAWQSEGDTLRGQEIRNTHVEVQAADEQTQAADEQTRAADEQTRAADEQTRAADEQARAADEQARAADEQARAADEQTRAAQTKARNSPR